MQNIGHIARRVVIGGLYLAQQLAVEAAAPLLGTGQLKQQIEVAFGFAWFHGTYIWCVFAALTTGDFQLTDGCLQNDTHGSPPWYG